MAAKEDHMVESDGRMKVVIYYGVWATMCAALAGIVVALLHTWFFSYHVGRSGFLQTLVSDIEAALAIAAGQGAVAVLTGSVLARLGRGLEKTVLLGLLIGAFDFVLNFVQMVVPKTELGWGPDIVILAVAAAVITAYGSATTSAA
jgi:hypothetical protein